MGEPLCFAAFGPLAVPAFFLALLPSSPYRTLVGPTVWWASVLVGITTAIILFCSHFHQLEDDRAIGKMSPVVRLGTTARAVQVSELGGSLEFNKLHADSQSCISFFLPFAGCVPCL